LKGLQRTAMSAPKNNKLLSGWCVLKSCQITINLPVHPQAWLHISPNTTLQQTFHLNHSRYRTKDYQSSQLKKIDPLPPFSPDPKWWQELSGFMLAAVISVMFWLARRIQFGSPTFLISKKSTAPTVFSMQEGNHRPRHFLALGRLPNWDAGKSEWYSWSWERCKICSV